MYNFAEQLNWAAKIGLIRDARRRRKIERWTSVAELATYVFTINVSMLTLWRCAQRETRARREYHSRGLRKKDDDADDAADFAKAAGAQLATVDEPTDIPAAFLKVLER